MFLKKHFLLTVPWNTLVPFWSPQNTHKQPSYVPPHCVSPECSVMTSYPVARPPHHDRSNFGARVGQIKQSLSTCGDIYTCRAGVVLGGEFLVQMGLIYYSNWVVQFWTRTFKLNSTVFELGHSNWTVQFFDLIREALLLCTVLPICSYTYSTTTTVPGHWNWYWRN